MTSTPWGPSQHKTAFCRGINHYSTAGHGGFKVSDKLNLRIPEFMRNPSGWYEEDCEWSIVAVCFPKEFTPEDITLARKTLKDWFPDLYERFFEEIIPPGESIIKDKETWTKEHENDFVVGAAWGDWHKNVPKGMVGVYAQVPSTQEEVFCLVPRNVYESKAFPVLHSFEPFDASY